MWLVIGGESGPGARPLHLEWARELIRTAHEARVAVFMKQLGARPFENGAALRLPGRKGDDPEQWPAELQIREYPIARQTHAPALPGGDRSQESQI